MVLIATGIVIIMCFSVANVIKSMKYAKNRAPKINFSSARGIIVICFEKLAATYSPAGLQYHRRGRA